MASSACWSSSCSCCSSSGWSDRGAHLPTCSQQRRSPTPLSARPIEPARRRRCHACRRRRSWSSWRSAEVRRPAMLGSQRPLTTLAPRYRAGLPARFAGWFASCASGHGVADQGGEHGDRVAG
jgi:hypothetical protein